MGCGLQFASELLGFLTYAVMSAQVQFPEHSSLSLVVSVLE